MCLGPEVSRLMLISIVTVVKDDVTGFLATRDSMLAQELSACEWIVVDGSSDTGAIPPLVEAAADRLSVNYAHQPPSGVYSAMNQALAMAHGLYVYFLNAGDEFYAADVLRRVRDALAPEPVWAFGPVGIISPTGTEVITPQWDYRHEQAQLFSRGHFPPHQGTIVHAQTLRSIGGFDVSYQIAADYAVCLRLSQLADPLTLPFVVAKFPEGGISTSQWQKSFREFHRARRSILHPVGVRAVKERWNTCRQYFLVFAHREIRPRLSLSARKPSSNQPSK